MITSTKLPFRLSTIGNRPMIGLVDPSACDWRQPFFDEALPDDPTAYALEPLEEWNARNSDAETGFELTACIFHVSRCGSTLLARNIAAVPGATILSEPSFLDQLWQAADLEFESTARAVIAAWQNWAKSENKRLVIKCASHLTPDLSDIMAILPEAAALALHREPARVMESLDRKRPEGLRHAASNGDGDVAERLLGISDDAYNLTAASRYCRSLDAMQSASGRLMMTSYEEMPDHFPEILQHLRLTAALAPAWSATLDAKASKSALGRVYFPVQEDRLTAYTQAHAPLLEALENHYAEFKRATRSA